MNQPESTNPNDQIAAAIRHRLIDLNLTQTDLGRHLFPDSSRPGNVISQYARGTRGGLSDNLLDILKVLGARRITVEWGPLPPRIDPLQIRFQHDATGRWFRAFGPDGLYFLVIPTDEPTDPRGPVFLAVEGTIYPMRAREAQWYWLTHHASSRLYVITNVTDPFAPRPTDDLEAAYRSAVSQIDQYRRSPS